MRALRKFHDLLPRERLILAQAWCFLILSDVALKIFSFNHLLTFLQTRCSNSRRKVAPYPNLCSLRVAWLVKVAGRYSPVDATCLKQALVLCWFLGKQGLDATLQIGVARDRESLIAHAWVEQNGQVLIGEGGIEKFQILLRT